MTYFERSWRFVCSLWEVPDDIPEASQGEVITLVAAMSLSPQVSGDIGKLHIGVVDEACLIAKEERSLVSVSSRLRVGNSGEVVAEVCGRLARKNGAVTVMPIRPKEDGTRNTHFEAEFVVERAKGLLCHAPTRIVVVTDSIHMRRALSTFRKELRGTGIDLKWKSVNGYKNYGRGYAQKRYLHPLFFLSYELGAFGYFLIRRWI